MNASDIPNFYYHQYLNTMHSKILFPIILLLFAVSASAQSSGPRFFHYHEINGHLKELRQNALEYIAVSGDNTPEGDLRIIDTLRMFLGQKTPPGTKGLWPHYHGVVKNLQIRRVGWRELPEELKDFRHLFELSFVECPHISLQSINDQMKTRRDANEDDDLYRKFKNDIVSLSFSDADFDTKDSCHLEKELLGELKELRFVRIGNFGQQCRNLLTELNRAYPELGWLTIEDCGLDNTQNLLPLYHFKKLRSLSLARNHLTRLPKVSASLRALDASYNFIRDFPVESDSNSLKDLDFLYLECNLFDYYKLYRILSDSLVDHMEVFTYDPCNFDTLDDLKRISAALDKRKVAVFMPFVSRYENDFTPTREDCERCKPQRYGFINELLKGVEFLNATGAPSRITLMPNGRLALESTSVYGIDQRFFTYKKLKSCGRDVNDPLDANQVWNWELCFGLEDATGNPTQNLLLYIKDKQGKMTWEE